MTKLAQLVNWVLGFLPFNGDKTKVGFILTLACEIPQAFPNFDVLAWVDQRLLALGVPLLVVGVIHKVAKKILEENSLCQ